jgi:transposase
MHVATVPLGRPLKPLNLSTEERQALEAWARRPKTSQALAMRARLILASATGTATNDVAKDQRVTSATVSKWRQRFLKQRLDGLVDEPRSGAPRTVTDEDVDRVVAMTLESKAPKATHWSLRSLAKQSGMSISTVGRIWRAFGLRPHRSEYFKLSPDPQFVEKVRDIVGLYMNPPDHAVVLCADEKSQIQALDRTQPLLPMRLGQAERRTHDYKRHGTTTLFAAFNTKVGTVIGQMHRRHRAIEFRKFLDTVEGSVPATLNVHLILDNSSIHKSPTIKRWLLRHPRFQLHFTPTYASWINLVERWFGLLTDQQIRRGTHRSTRQLEDAIRTYIAATNAAPKAFVWTKTADEILDSVRRFCLRTSGSGH